jgi:hypothetical protein
LLEHPEVATLPLFEVRPTANAAAVTLADASPVSADAAVDSLPAARASPASATTAAKAAAEGALEAMPPPPLFVAHGWKCVVLVCAMRPRDSGLPAWLSGEPVHPPPPAAVAAQPEAPPAVPAAVAWRGLATPSVHVHGLADPLLPKSRDLAAWWAGDDHRAGDHRAGQGDRGLSRQRRLRLVVAGAAGGDVVPLSMQGQGAAPPSAGAAMAVEGRPHAAEAGEVSVIEHDGGHRFPSAKHIAQNKALRDAVFRAVGRQPSHVSSAL